MEGYASGLADASLIRPGVVLGSRYRLVARIGAGGMGEVWRAEHTSLGTAAAVKVIDASSGADAAERLGRFHQEARAAAHLRSRHIVHVLDHGVEGRLAFIAMELLVGEALDQRIARLGRLAPAEAARVIAGVARGLALAHASGVLHRDLKPANVFLAREAGGEVVKLLDFGIAKILGPRADQQVQTHQGNIIGTPSYMSPEQVRGQQVDPRSDLWQMGVIAFECVTGRRPFDGATLGDTFMRICTMPLPPPSSIAPVPPGFDAWVARALSRDPAARFSSATEMAAALLLVLSPGDGDISVTLSTGGRTGGAWASEVGGGPPRSRRFWLAAGAGVAAALATAGVLWFWPRPAAPPSASAVPLPVAEAAPTNEVHPPALPAPTGVPLPSDLPDASPSASGPPGPSASPGPPGSSAAPPSVRPAPPKRPVKPEDPLGI